MDILVLDGTCLQKKGLHLTLAYQINITDGFSQQKEWQYTALACQVSTIEDRMLCKQRFFLELFRQPRNACRGYRGPFR